MLIWIYIGRYLVRFLVLPDLNNETTLAILQLCKNIPSINALSKKLHKTGARILQAIFRIYGGILTRPTDLCKRINVIEHFVYTRRFHEDR